MENSTTTELTLDSAELHVWDLSQLRWVPVGRRLKPLTYVAGPYTGSTPGIQGERFRLLTIAACMLTHCKRWNVFSPITHSHPMHELGLGGDWEFWKKIDTEYLSVSERIVIVTLDGWEKSTGVNAETKIAREMGLPLFHMTEPQVGGGHGGCWCSWLTDNHTGEFLQYKMPRNQCNPLIL